MSEKPRLIFECDNCGSSFTLPLNTVRESSVDDNSNASAWIDCQDPVDVSNYE